MPLTLLTTTAFEKDLKRLRKQGKDLAKMDEIVDLLQSQQLLPERCKPHPLRGSWTGTWDCHIGPDWLLLYRLTGTELILVRTGRHSELFD